MSLEYLGSGELIVYPWSVFRRCPPSSSSTLCSYIFFSETVWPIEAEIYVDWSLLKGKESLYAASGSHDQDGHHAHIYGKNLLPPETGGPIF